MLDKNGERMLAYTVTVDNVTPIDGADNIELAHIGGWTVIVNKQDYKPGDMAVFFEIDSLLPETEWSEFLRKKKFKVKTYKLGKFGVISQGLLMPMTILPDDKEYELHEDVTNVLGVKYYAAEDNERKGKSSNPNAKYNNMAARHPKIAKKPWFKWLMKRMWGRKILFALFGKKKDSPKKFPSWIKKTDEDRCLIGNTKIDTDQGKLRIADIVNKKLDIKVKSYNINTNEVEYMAINSYQKYPLNEKLIEIEYPYCGNSFRKNRIVCSLDHKFFTGEEYASAKDIRVGDKIYMSEVCYGDEVIPAIYGMLLGDSSIIKEKRSASNNIRISTTHGEAQLDYLKLKQHMFGEDNFAIYEGKSGYCDNVVYRGSLVMDVNVSNHVLNDCYSNGKKIITQSMIDKITPMSLALWYMDDGSIKHRSANDSNNPNIVLSTCGFTKEENEILIDMLQNKFGVEANLRKEKDKYWSIYITVKGTKVFLDIIKDYIPACMKYKTVEEYENVPCVLNNIVFERNEMLVPVVVSDVKEYNNKYHDKHIYDIEVDCNHNFFANNILVHNCENMMWIIENKEPMVVTEKIDGTSTTFFLDLTGRKPDFGVCSRNVRQLDQDQKSFHEWDDICNVYWEMAIKYNVEEALKDIAKKHNVKRVVLQGETYGASVQGNPYKMEERDFAAFNLVFNGERLGSIEAKEILSEYDVPFVPILETNYVFPNDFEEIKLSADGKSVINKRCLREGLVIRSLDGKLSTKNISRNFLLKKKD